MSEYQMNVANEVKLTLQKHCLLLPIIFLKWHKNLSTKNNRKIDDYNLQIPHPL